jgi:hypothetical protein
MIEKRPLESSDVLQRAVQELDLAGSDPEALQTGIRIILDLVPPEALQRAMQEALRGASPPADHPLSPEIEAEVRTLLADNDPRVRAALDALMLVASRQGYEKGFQEGEANGYTRGQRKAKGRQDEPKKRGAKPIMSNGFKNLMLMHVGQRQIDGKGGRPPDLVVASYDADVTRVRADAAPGQSSGHATCVHSFKLRKTCRRKPRSSL